MGFDLTIAIAIIMIFDLFGMAARCDISYATLLL